MTHRATGGGVNTHDTEAGLIQPGRRDFLKSTAALAVASGVGLFIPLAAFASERPPGPPALLGPWVQIAPDDTVTLFFSQSEMGQSSYTGLTTLLADELDVDIKKVRVADAPMGPDCRITLVNFTARFTGGSSSTSMLMERLRKAGAAAREMLVAAASQGWQVSASQCTTELGHVAHPPTGRKQSYGDFATAASRLPIPTSPTLKTPAQWRYIGKPVHRLDSPLKVNGSAIFGIDVTVANMLTALVTHVPAIGGGITGTNDAELLAMPGVKAVIPLESSAVLVVADSWWHALEATNALKLTTSAPKDIASTENIRARMIQALDRGEGLVARQNGDVEATFARGGVLRARYELPYVAHATLEPPCALVDVRAHSVEAWLPTQSQDLAVAILHNLTKVPEDKITVHTTFLGGGFGRKGQPDAVSQAAIASKVLQAPVKVIWRREEDIRHDIYRPGFMHELKGSLDARGDVAALDIRVTAQSLLSQVIPSWVRNGIDETTVEGLVDIQYAIPNTRVEQLHIDAPIQLGFLRSVGQGPNAFVVESFLDEMAHTGKQDPYRLRRHLLRHNARALAVLDAAAKMSNWDNPTSGRALGIAYRGYANRGSSLITYVAQVAEVSNVGGKLKVHRVWCAVDCGIPVNPDSIRAQMEGAIGFGMTTALYSKVTFKAGSVEQGSFDTYPLMKIAEMPDIVVEILRNEQPSSAIGEVGLPPLAPAVTNAWFTLTGQRLRSLPLIEHGIV